jgi:hypothetical protein
MVGEAHLKKILQNNTNRKTAPIQSHGLATDGSLAPHLGQNGPLGSTAALHFRQVIAGVSAFDPVVFKRGESGLARMDFLSGSAYGTNVRMESMLWPQLGQQKETRFCTLSRIVIFRRS